MTDADLASAIAEAAGRLLVAIRQSDTLHGKALGAAGDLTANAFILAALAANRPADGVLSEESADSDARLAKSRVWIVDPLDGTREYSEGRDDWAVHVALAVDGVATIGAVAQPGVGLYRSDAVRAMPEPAHAIIVSRSRPPVEAERVAAALGVPLIGMGSAGAKAMAVLRGEAVAYVHSGGQHEWDSAAPVAVCAAAGLHVSRLDGSPLRYNGANPYMPDLLICHPAWRDRILDAIG
ncbi:MAG: 3(2),5-bisphosphate nucleotidase CysQ [Sphingomonas bacterium]|nr:3(2),5-bisphosphate nucleotidase CysQ [Sphingomonas bacterium]MDB5718125.1 3(2),5-bisphosphate nucleotidase CysQ [Sphingomonas bacterium]